MIHPLVINTNGKVQTRDSLLFRKYALTGFDLANGKSQTTKYIMTQDVWEDLLKWSNSDQ